MKKDAAAGASGTDQSAASGTLPSMPIAPPVSIAPEPVSSSAAAGQAPLSMAASVPVAATVSSSSAPVVSGAARLVLKRGGALTNEVFPVGGRVVIGRFDAETGPVDIDLANLPEAGYVSRVHAEIWRDGQDQWWVKDHGSRNGTFVRASGEGAFQRVTGDHALQLGDEVALGNARFAFQRAE